MPMPSNDTTPKRKPNAGSFRPGPDSRRHTFTPEECSEGFWAGLASYVEGGGEARNFPPCAAEGHGQARGGESPGQVED